MAIEDYIDISAFNKEVSSFGRETKNTFLQEMRAQKMKFSGKQDSLQNITLKVRKTNGIATRITFPFSKHGIYVKLGVGNGTPIAMAGTGATNRKPKNWITERLLDSKVKELADRIEPYYFGAAVRVFNREIKG